ncbi:SDR family oxidoreductase [Jannaschia sp. Os4]|uniref:SDR family oxidoreductase n=1 Tax=Jannaschia sp. Os4 TaxID=2807617 RepID=UPI001939B8FB|nr:SDR family oxidoreductase [Jannaschia sp. Os4]MBM2574862.1 SDR family oxidoreductase [Jannaschia sp. Os4]
MQIDGAPILITGASRGIGAATARHLAARGAKVGLVARSAAPLEALAEETGGLALALDVADWDAVAGAVARMEAAFGPVAGLVNNAGLIDPIARIEDSDPKAWATVVNVNLTGAYNALRAVLPGMGARGTGVVVNISSGAATGALEGWSHYCATKAGLLSLTKVADKEMAPKGVSVVGLSPGTVATEMQREIKASGINPVSRLDWEAHIPAEEVAQAIGWLFEAGAARHAGTDFSLKTPEGRAEVGLPPRG